MILAAQYYRAPFPEKKYWKEDLDRMRASGLNAIQLWVMWSWVESEPGAFDFSDYDELFDEAEKRGLGVILSTIAELQPLWIHRLVPDAYMIDNFGNKVISSNRVEAHQGLTPGGCFDNPSVLEGMRLFLRKTAERYAGRENLLGWDCWNELRWNVQSDGLVCFCPYTLEAFRQWLKNKYTDLAGLNNVWKRRYCSWEDVFPGKMPNRPYTEMMEFEAFMQWRSAEHARFRYDIIKAYDPVHPVLAHAGQPSYRAVGDKENHAINRGNDFEIASKLDGYGCSHFPFWHKVSDVDFGVRVEFSRSAANGGEVWVSELQGGSARNGFEIFPSVQAKPQQRWVWNGYGRGAKSVIFWCWRDEVFGKESSGYGLAGLDGLADERLAMMGETGAILAKHGSLLDEYVPDAAKVGVVFEPDTYNLGWAEDSAAVRARDSITGYMSALERVQVPYDIVDNPNLGKIRDHRLLIMPWPLVVSDKKAGRIIDFVQNGGTLLIEADADAYTSTGFYRISGLERSFAHALGIEDLGRRVLRKDSIVLEMDGRQFALKVSAAEKDAEALPGAKGAKAVETNEYFTPLKENKAKFNSRILSRDNAGNVLAFVNEAGKGRVIVLGSFIGRIYCAEPYSDFDKFIRQVCIGADAQHPMKVESEGLLQWKTGVSGDSRLLFVINPGRGLSFSVIIPGDMILPGGQVEELRSGKKIEINNTADGSSFNSDIEEGGYFIFRWPSLQK